MGDRKVGDTTGPRIFGACILIAILFVTGCTAKIFSDSQKDDYPEFCMEVQSWERGDFCNVFYD